MKQNHRIIHYSILATLLCATALPANAAVKVSNASRSNRVGVYQQVAAQPVSAAPTASADVATPTASVDRFNSVTNNSQADTNVAGIDRLQACKNIYPNGEFEWAVPTVGAGAGGAPTCVSVVELRGYQMGEGGSDLILARGKLAAGDGFKCNISEFPEDPSLFAGQADITVTVPADREPTMEDVIAVMNQEQKQNAGLKIAASVLVGGLGGNIAGKNEVGKDGLFGGGKDKVKSTVIGAVGAGALTTAATFSGKIAGDTIMSAGTNAAFGAITGNIMSTGDSVLRIEDCKIGGEDKECLWGLIDKGEDLDAGTPAYVNIASDDNTTYICDTGNKNCTPKELIGIYVTVKDAKGVAKRVTLSELEDSDFAALRAGDCSECFIMTEAKEMINGSQNNGNGLFIKIDSAKVSGQKIAAMLPGIENTAFGLKQSDWKKIKQNNPNLKPVGRTNTGEAFELPAEYTLDDFYPMIVDATDGGIIDLGNKARLKATLTGAGVGGALGAYSAYQGAQDEVSARWVAAVREYKDSLQKVVCMTGKRFLGFYNDDVVIPTPLSE